MSLMGRGAAAKTAASTAGEGAKRGFFSKLFRKPRPLAPRPEIPTGQHAANLEGRAFDVTRPNAPAVHPMAQAMGGKPQQTFGNLTQSFQQWRNRGEKPAPSMPNAVRPASPPSIPATSPTAGKASATPAAAAQPATGGKTASQPAAAVQQASNSKAAATGQPAQSGILGGIKNLFASMAAKFKPETAATANPNAPPTSAPAAQPKMSPANMLSRGIFSTEEADRQSQIDLAKEETGERERAVETLKSFGKSLALGAVGLTLFAKALASRHLNSLREFAGVHGGFAREFAQTDVQSFQLRQRTANATAGTGEDSLKAFREFREDLQPMREATTTIKNVLTTGVFQYLSGILKGINLILEGVKAIPIIGAAVDALLANQKKNQAPAGRHVVDTNFRGNWQNKRPPIPPIP
jgi:hypothetical protein